MLDQLLDNCIFLMRCYSVPNVLLFGLTFIERNIVD